MKKQIKNIFLTTCALFAMSISIANAQVTPTTTNVELFCHDSDLSLGAPPANQEWVVKYSVTQTTTPNEGVDLTSNTIPAAELTTGYYYISTVGNASNPDICESEMVEVPVYKFAALTATLDASDYCFEDAGDQEFEVTTSSTDTYATFGYQWYTVVGGTETPIAGATNATYAPNAAIAVGTTTTYRVKVGYLVGGSRYCSAIQTEDVTVAARPSTPTITIGGTATGETQD